MIHLFVDIVHSFLFNNYYGIYVHLTIENKFYKNIEI